MSNKIVTTIIVAVLLAVTMIGLRHTDKLNDQIKFKQIELRDNSAKLKLLDKKYLDLNKQLDAKDADKVKIEQQLKDLQQERDKLKADLQAKLDAKAKDIAVKAQSAVTAPVRMQTAYASSPDEDKAFIYQHESGNNPNAVNSIGCRGLGQACPGSKLPCDADYACQDAYFTNYMLNRYGSWANARAFWEANRWW